MGRRIVAPSARSVGQEQHGEVFSGLSARSVHRILSKLGSACGLDGFHPHSFRHQFATRILEKGTDLQAAQELLGQASSEATAIYLGVTAVRPRHAIDLPARSCTACDALASPASSLALPTVRRLGPEPRVSNPARSENTAPSPLGNS